MYADNINTKTEHFISRQYVLKNERNCLSSPQPCTDRVDLSKGFNFEKKFPSNNISRKLPLFSILIVGYAGPINRTRNCTL